MPRDAFPGQSAFRTLDHPRALNAAERRLLSRLAASLGSELTAQTATAVVMGKCACGCSSVQLATAGAPLPAKTMSRLSETNRSDYLAINSTGRTAEGHDVSVILHVVEGRLHELEVFDPEAGQGVAVDPGAIVALRQPEVS